MKLREFTLPVSLLAGALLLLSGCFLDRGSDGAAGPEPVYETAPIEIAIPVPEGGTTGSMTGALFVGTFADVTRVTVTVAGEDKFGDEQNPLATADLTLESDGVWRAVIPDLPVDPVLTFTARGYNDADEEVFSGVTTQVLTGSADLVVVAMDPVDDGVAILFPVIESITLPGEIINNEDRAVSVAVRGSASETLSHQITSGGGTFTPDSGSILLTGSGTGTITTTYSAPAAVGTYGHSVRVTNSQGNAVEADFDTLVVYELTDADVEVTFAPVITAILGKRSGAGVVWTATLTDDKPLSELSYAWSFSGSGGAVFSPANTNPGALTGYDETVAGTITLSVTDGDGLTTTVDFALVAGQFPDVVVINTDFPTVLFVDDDWGLAGTVTWSDILDALGVAYDIEVLSPSGNPVSDLSAYEVVIWSIGDRCCAHLIPPNVTALMAYLDGGGALLYTGGHNVLDEPYADAFIRSYLGLANYRGNMPTFGNLAAPMFAVGSGHSSVGTDTYTYWVWNGGNYRTMFSGFDVGLASAIPLRTLQPTNNRYPYTGPYVAVVNETGTFKAMTWGFDINHLDASQRTQLLENTLLYLGN
jgi:hypothetical protein